MKEELIQVLKKKFGNQFKREEEIRTRFAEDWSRQFQQLPTAVFFPENTEQLASFVKIANQEKIIIVPAGGLTGLSGGATAIHQDEVIVSLEKMNSILEFSKVDPSITVEAGIITEKVREYVADKGWLFPMDFGAKGSSQIGGNIATNVGGLNVIQYGNIRNWVTGLKVVTGTGEILELNQGLIKNATGYDLRHLFIGSEGTLGIITEATLRLTKDVSNNISLLFAFNNIKDVQKILNEFKSVGTIAGAEFMTQESLNYALIYLGLSHPFQDISAYYLLIEIDVPNPLAHSRLMVSVENLYKKGIIENDRIAEDRLARDKLWSYRENITLGISSKVPYKMDISVRPSLMAKCIESIIALREEEYLDWELILYGHVGDGNLHIGIIRSEGKNLEEGVIAQAVFKIVKKLKGSISAEHGVGQLKKKYLAYSRSEMEIAYMKSIKQIFDPNNIMNRGKIFDIN